jgi:hypothetical protein
MYLRLWWVWLRRSRCIARPLGLAILVAIVLLAAGYFIGREYVNRHHWK